MMIKFSNNMVFFKVLLFCLITYGYGRPSDSEEHDEIMREAKKEKYYQHDNVGELSRGDPEPSTTENVLNKLKSIARLRMAEARNSADETISREELETLKELLDKNLLKYQNYDERSAASRRRPNDPYIGQILHNLNGELSSNGPGNSYDDRLVQQQSQRYQTPIRRKIIRHTVFATPLNGGVGNPNRVYGGDGSSRIEWSSPWADYFPILIKDPFQSMINSFSEIIEYGPAADICRHGGETDQSNGARESRMSDNGDGGDAGTGVRADSLKRSRRNTSARTTTATATDEEKGILNNARPFLRPHHASTTTTAEPPKVYRWGNSPDKAVGDHNGDTGPQIKRLVVRRGGVAIAGPGGIATAGSGGTAIVGPGGSAYSSKDSASAATADVPTVMAPPPGISMAGYGPQAVQGPPGYFAAYPHVGYARSTQPRARGGTAVLSTDGVAYTFPAPSRGLTAAVAADGPPYAASAGHQINLPDGAKLIATGPIVYYNPEPRKRSHKGKKSQAGSSTKKHQETAP